MSFLNSQFSFLNALLAEGESARAAFVRERVRPEELAETLAAFANARGGSVVLGAGGRARPKPEGLLDAERAAELALDAALLCSPPLVLPLPSRISLDEHTLVLVEVPAGLGSVYAVNGRYLWRHGAANVPIPAHELRRLLLERGAAGWERQASEAPLDALDAHKIERYLKRAGPVATEDPYAWLLRRGCLSLAGSPGRGYVPTNAGLLLFARDIERWLPQCELTLLRYRGLEMSDDFERLDLRDTLPEQAHRAERWLVDRMRRGSRMGGLEREDWIEYPPAVVREAMINAIAHRDYAARGDGIRIALFGDRLEIYSPGRLPGHVTVENIRDERYSRNQTLVQVLGDLGLIERLGYGVDRMIKQMSAESLPPPSFRETAAGFSVTLRGRVTTDALPGGVDTQAWLRLGLNERQITALLYLAEHRRITNREFRDLGADISDETARRDLADLVDRGLLIRIGDRRGTYYILRG